MAQRSPASSIAIAVEKLRQVYVVSRAIEADVDFFEKALGLELQFRDGNRWVQFSAGPISFALASEEEGGSVPPGVPVPVFQVVDLDASCAELRARGHTIGEIRDMGGHGRSAQATAPGGAPLMLFQKTGA